MTYFYYSTSVTYYMFDNEFLSLGRALNHFGFNKLFIYCLYICMPFVYTVALIQIKHIIQCKLRIQIVRKKSFTFYNCIKGKLCDSCIILVYVIHFTNSSCLIEIDYAIIDRMSIIKFRKKLFIASKCKNDFWQLSFYIWQKFSETSSFL